MVLRRVHVRYHLGVGEEQRELAERVHGFHARFCPVARSLEGAVDCTTELELVAPPPGTGS